MRCGATQKNQQGTKGVATSDGCPFLFTGNSAKAEAARRQPWTFGSRLTTGCGCLNLKLERDGGVGGGMLLCRDHGVDKLLGDVDRNRYADIRPAHQRIGSHNLAATVHHWPA